MPRVEKNLFLLRLHSFHKMFAGFNFDKKSKYFLLTLKCFFQFNI